MAAQVSGPANEGEEAPEAIFDTQLGDADVDLYAKGSWLTSMAFGWGSGYSPTGSIPSYTYPGMERGFVFKQVPDFSLSLWLMKRYYLEVTYKGGFDKNTLLLGYRGRPGEVLQWAKIGNAPITIPERASVPVPEGRAGTPAFGISLESPFSIHDLLVRYEDTQSETKTFLGTKSVDDSTLALDGWIHGRFFKLPVASLPATGLTVLIQDKSGTYTLGSSAYESLNGLSFRSATSDEVYLDTTKGTVRLAQSSTAALLVSWTGAPASFTDPVTGATITAESSVSGQSGYWYVMYLPGAYSSFELKDHYPVKSYSDGTSIGIYKKGTSDQVSDYTITAVNNQDWFTIGSTNSNVSPRYPPFWFLYPGLYYSGSKTSPNPVAAPGIVQEEIRISTQSTSQTNDLYLGTGVLPGSVTVTKNGFIVPITDFDVTTGKIDLNTPIFDNDNIVVTYQKEKEFQKPTDLAVYQGNQFTLNSKQDIQTMESFRWNLAQGRYTDSDMQAPGQIQGAVEWNGKEGPWTWKTGLKGSGVLSDSTGYRRLYGMNKETIQATLDSAALRPASAPYSISSWSSGGQSYSGTLTPYKKGTTYYRNFWSTDTITGLPFLSSATKAGVAQEGYKNGGTMGPYMTMGDDVRTDRLAVLESFLKTSEWSGFHVYFDKGQVYDLSTATKAVLSLRLGTSLPSNAHIYFQAGYLGNDFDGTGTVSSKVTTNWPGMSLMDRRNNWTLTYPLPEDSTWTNDSDGSGVIKRSSSLVTREITYANDLGSATSFSTTSTQWQTLVLSFTDDEKNLLKNSTGWRIIVVNGDTSDWSTAQTLYCSSAEFYGTNFALNQASSSTGHVFIQDIPETYATYAADKTLSSTYEETGRIFHSDSSTQKILEVNWTQAPWTISGRNNALRYSAYHTLVAYYRVAAATGSTPKITMALTDADGKGLTATWQAPVTTGWQRVKINIPDSRFMSAETGSVQIDKSGGAWDRMTISMANGTTAGTLYLAEIHCEDPLWEFTGTWTAGGTWTQDKPFSEPVLSLITGTHINTQSALSTTSSGKNSWLGQSDVLTNLGPSHWKAKVTILSETDKQEAHGAYSTQIPIGPVELQDEFSDYGYRTDGITLTLPYLGSLANSAKVQGPPVVLKQTYSSAWNNMGKPAIPDSWTTQLLHTLTETWSEKIPLETFGKQWTQSWGWYAPRDGIPQFVQMQQNGHESIPAAPLGFDLAWEFQNAQTKGSPWVVSPSSSWTVGFPFKWATSAGDWDLEQSFSRKVNLIDDNDGGMGISELPSVGMNRLFSVPYGPFGIPFQEQFSPNSLAGQPDNLSSGILESQSLTTVKRPRSFTWTDLAYPLQGDFTVDTQQLRESESLLFLNKAEVKLSSQALNLFGRSGAHPQFNWYETDEWSWNMTTGVSDGSKVENKQFLWGLGTLSKVYFTMKENVSLPVKFNGVWSYQSDYTLETGPSWEIRLPANLPFDIPRWLSPKAFPRELIHSLSLQMKWDWNYDATIPIFQKLYAIFKSTLKISEGGELVFAAQWGNSWQKNLYVVGLEASLDLKLSF